MSKLEGIFTDLSSADYHGSPGMSFTGLKQFMRSPAHYKAYLRSEKEQTAAQKLGTLVHMATLEPERFVKETVRMDGPLNTNPWKKQADEAKENGQIPIGKSMHEGILGMRDALMAHPDFNVWLSNGQTEVSMFWTDKETGVTLRCRPDIWIQKMGLVVDVKTCGDTDQFPRIEMVRNKYHWQACFYLMGASVLAGENLKSHVLACVETEDPYAVDMFAFDDASIERAMVDIRRGLIAYAECLNKDQWPAKQPGIKPVNLPEWAWYVEGEENYGNGA